MFPFIPTLDTMCHTIQSRNLIILGKFSDAKKVVKKYKTAFQDVSRRKLNQLFQFIGKLCKYPKHYYIHLYFAVSKNMEQLPKKWNWSCKQVSVPQIVEQRAKLNILMNFLKAP